MVPEARPGLRPPPTFAGGSLDYGHNPATVQSSVQVVPGLHISLQSTAPLAVHARTQVAVRPDNLRRLYLNNRWILSVGLIWRETSRKGKIYRINGSKWEIRAE